MTIYHLLTTELLITELKELNPLWALGRGVGFNRGRPRDSDNELVGGGKIEFISLSEVKCSGFYCNRMLFMSLL